MVAKYERVADDVRHKIRTGRLSPGDRLQPETALAADYKVSTPVVRQAMGVLRAEGLIESRHGIGTFVRAPRQRIRRESARHQWEKDRARTADTERRSTGATERDTGLSIDDLEFCANYQISKADKRIAPIFDVPIGTKMVRREYRTQLKAEGSPLNLITSYLVHDVVSANPKLLDAKNEPWPGGTQHQLYTVGIEVDRIIEFVTTRPPDAGEMEALDLTSGVAVFVVHKQTIDTSGRTVEYSDVILPGDRTELVFETQLTRWDKR